MNWGTKLVIGMVAFMTFIIVLAVLMFTSKTDALVDNDYYEKGLAYDKDYNSKEQVKKDFASPEISISAQYITLKFKQEAVGNIKLRRNADKRMDQHITLQTDSNHQAIIPTKDLAKGQWRLILSWISDGKSYLDEQEVMVK